MFGSFLYLQLRTSAKQDVISSELTRMKRTPITLNADDVLREFAKTDALASPIDQSFRNAAQKRAWEAQQIAQYGRPDAITPSTRAATFEALAKQDLLAWNRRFEELSIKLAALGYRVFPPTQPSNPIEGEPTTEAIKFIYEREALTVAADALRAANESIAGAAHQSQPEPTSN